MVETERFSRQSFLGTNSQEALAACVVGIVGLGGGGSHIVQQLAHLGFQRYVIYDDDIIEDSNLNRLVSGTTADVEVKAAKIAIAERTILGLQPEAEISAFCCKWQENPHPLRRCHIVFGCVDTYRGRLELETTLRRYLVNYIDIGMDVHGEDPPMMSGQIILSTPGGPCLRCLQFLTDEKLEAEARLYGDAGGRPQVVWPNGILASTAVGIAVGVVTNWTQKQGSHEYLVYNGNRGTLSPSITLRGRENLECPHYPANSVGDPVMMSL